MLHGVLGAFFGLGALYTLFRWTLDQFGGPGVMAMTRISFFELSFQLLILAASIFLCTGSSMVAIRKFLRI